LFKTAEIHLAITIRILVQIIGLTKRGPAIIVITAHVITVLTVAPIIMVPTTGTTAAAATAAQIHVSITLTHALFTKTDAKGKLLRKVVGVQATVAPVLI